MIDLRHNIPRPLTLFGFNDICRFPNKTHLVIKPEKTIDARLILRHSCHDDWQTRSTWIGINIQRTIVMRVLTAGPMNYPDWFQSQMSSIMDIAFVHIAFVLDHDLALRIDCWSWNLTNKPQLFAQFFCSYLPSLVLLWYSLFFSITLVTDRYYRVFSTDNHDVYTLLLCLCFASWCFRRLWEYFPFNSFWSAVTRWMLFMTWHATSTMLPNLDLYFQRWWKSRMV